MASSGIPSLEELSAAGVRSLLLPFLLNFASISPSENQREVTVVVNSSIGSVTFIEGSFSIDTFLSKEDPLPASKSSIDSMPVVEVVERGIECAICLSEFQVGGEAKEMPCEHRYHIDCVDKWLMINGSCPICRYTLPVEEERTKDVVDVESRDDSGSSRERRRGEPVVFHVLLGRDRNVHSESGSNSGSNGLSGSQELLIDTDMYSESDSNSLSNGQSESEEFLIDTAMYSESHFNSGSNGQRGFEEFSTDIDMYSDSVSNMDPNA